MGDRVGLQFRDRWGDLSHVLHSHWAGRDAMIAAQRWLQMDPGIDRDMGCDEALCRFLQWCGGHTNSYWDFDIQEPDDYDDTEDNGTFIVDIVEKVVG